MTSNTAESPEACVPGPKPQEFQFRITAEAKEGRVHLGLPKGMTAKIEPEMARELAGHLISHSYVADGKTAPDRVTINFKDEAGQ